MFVLDSASLAQVRHERLARPVRHHPRIDTDSAAHHDHHVVRGSNRRMIKVTDSKRHPARRFHELPMVVGETRHTHDCIGVGQHNRLVRKLLDGVDRPARYLKRGKRLCDAVDAIQFHRMPRIQRRAK